MECGAVRVIDGVADMVSLLLAPVGRNDGLAFWAAGENSGQRQAQVRLRSVDGLDDGGWLFPRLAEKP